LFPCCQPCAIYASGQESIQIRTPPPCFRHLHGRGSLFSSPVPTHKTSSMPMAATPPSQSNPAGDDRNLVPVTETTAVTFEDKAQLFWQNNRNAVFGVIVL